MPQLNGGGGDDLGANDEMISFKDEGEQEEKISDNSSAERDLADVKSSLVNETETHQNSSSDSEVSDLGVRAPGGRGLETFGGCVGRDSLFFGTQYWGTLSDEMSFTMKWGAK